MSPLGLITKKLQKLANRQRSSAPILTAMLNPWPKGQAFLLPGLSATGQTDSSIAAVLPQA